MALDVKLVGHGWMAESSGPPWHQHVVGGQLGGGQPGGGQPGGGQPGGSQPGGSQPGGGQPKRWQV